jgi:hypothetical protein
MHATVRPGIDPGGPLLSLGVSGRQAVVSAWTFPQGAFLYREGASGWADARQVATLGTAADAGTQRPVAIAGNVAVAGTDVYVRPTTGWLPASQPQATLTTPAGNTCGDPQIQGSTIAILCGSSTSDGGGAVLVYQRPAGGLERPDLAGGHDPGRPGGG